ncbi:MAG: ornithine carbamoyltransferase [Pirellulales bacterium]
MRHFLSLFDINQTELNSILSLAAQVKALLNRGVRPNWLPGHVLAMLFEKPSLRTRVSFEAGIAQLGGTSMYLGADVGWQKRESLSDFTRVLAEYVDFVVCRTKSHQSVVDMASFNCVPVINGLTDTAHPCQALGDLLSMLEVDSNLGGKTLAFVGDGNNVAQSLVHACAMMGMKFRLLGPAQYFIKDSFVQQVAKVYPNLDFVQSDKPEKILPSANFVYTDVWISMGQEAEAAERIRAFSPFQLSEKLMALTGTKSKIMHCLPARRGEEITDGVIDSSDSIIVQQAGNRMHAQKALLLWMSLQHGTLDSSQLSKEGIML